MKTIHITADHGHMIEGRHWTPGDGPISVPDDVADQIVALGTGELVPTGLEARVATGNPIADAVSPLVPNADPLHAARALGMVTEEHPGLVALGEVADRPKAGRVKPTEVVKPSDVGAAVAGAQVATPAPEAKAK